jgi:hypothetical protein
MYRSLVRATLNFFDKTSLAREATGPARGIGPATVLVAVLV